MAQPAKKVLYALDQRTGELEEAPEVPRAPYAFDGPHINVGIRRGRELASAASGLTDREFRVLVWYWFATEEVQGAVMLTAADVAKELGMSADTLGRTVKVLKKARLLLEAGGLGRTTFYRCTPHLAFIGTGFAHREAVKDWNPPESTVREPRDHRRNTKRGEA
ncbi:MULTISPECIES: helix-turn-helix domain-containing protein [unclassified Streptomyces]|uniref:helix-turn-helix domain-containing protein n=1 Tax=unclassified Streptomyces TaxID=2593676 RepID=UPI002E1A87DC|nr:MarR family transcriptional regulator [Streptomyces sp. NBC_01023]